MPVEVKEIVIRAVIGRGGGGQAETAPNEADRADIVAECVEQVLQILKEREER